MVALVFIVYLATLAPDLTFEHFGSDGGDLISAAWTMGVPHPPGYPTYTLLAALFSRLPLGTIAYRVNLSSTVYAALTVYFVYLATWELEPVEDRNIFIPLVTSAILAFSSLLWSQAVIAEVYTLLALFAAILLWLLTRWRNGGSIGYLWGAAFTMGIGLGNQLSLIFFVPAAVVLLWSERHRWFQIKVMLQIIGFALLGLSIYIYLPLAASREPPVNWGNPTTWKQFLWVVTGKQYQPFVFGLPVEEIPGRLFQWVVVFNTQFGWWGLIIAAIGGAVWWMRDRAFFLFSIAWALPLMVYTFFYNTGDAYVILLPVFMLLAIWWGESVRILILYGSRLATQRAKSASSKTSATFWRWWPPLIILFLILVSLTSHWTENDLSHDISAKIYLTEILSSVPEGSLVVTRRDRATFGLWYETYVNEQREDIAVVNGRMLAYTWYREQMRSLYAPLSVPRPEGDITSDELVRDFILQNIDQRPVYATDPAQEWEMWFNFISEEGANVYQVQVKPNVEDSDN